MKCPNCGKEMAEGRLYCEACGQEIHIVPDFEPELELSIEQTIQKTIQNIADELRESTPFTGVIPRKGKIGKWSVLTICLILGIFVAVFVSLKLRNSYQYNSLEYQTSMARKLVTSEQYDEAIACYSRALELDDENIELVFRLAEVYFLKNDKTEYEHLLWKIVESGEADFLQLELAYGKLIAIYRAKEDYQAIHEMLMNSNNPDIVSVYWGYVAEPPQFSIQEGYYANIQALRLTTAGNGRIYYTLDGSDPNEASEQYSIPIILDNGEHLVKAIFINDKGVHSDIITKEYHVENNEIDAPEVDPLGGDYQFPLDIEVLYDVEGIYYTTDGSAPTANSKKYTEPIHMPLGKSTFKFAKIVDGVAGNIAEVSYNLVMNTDFSAQDAVDAVVQYALDSGKIYHKEGYYNDTRDCYCYEYQYVTKINRIDDFYVVAEIYRTGEGELSRTGLEYAVNAYTGEIFKLYQDNGRMSLIELEITHSFEEE